MAVLSISTNTRLLGMAIITKNGLAAYSIRLYKSPWSASKANKIVTSLEPCVRRYSIKSVVLSIPPEHHQNREGKILRLKLLKHFQAKGIPVQMVPTSTLYAFCPVGQKPTKKMAMKSIVQRCPELRPYLQKELQNKNRYYTKLFEAVAAGLLE